MYELGIHGHCPGESLLSIYSEDCREFTLRIGSTDLCAVRPKERCKPEVERSNG